MANIKQNIINLLKKLSFKDYLIIGLVFVSLCSYFAYKHYYNKAKTPIVVYDKDSLEIYKNKLKEEYQSKEIYLQNLKDLKKQNTDLAQEVKNLKDHPIIVTKTKIETKIDTVYAESDTVYLSNVNDSIYNLMWHIQEPNNYYAIFGQTNVYNDFSKFQTIINKLSLTTNLTLDVVDNGKNGFRIIGKTDNPYISITNMNGIILNPNDNNLKKYYKPKRFSIGPQVGYGLTGRGKLDFTIGLGLQYGIIQF